MTADDIRQEIEETRQHLGETVDELAAKADLKARARARVAEISGRVTSEEAARYRWPAALISAGVTICVTALIWRWKQA